MQIEVSNLRKVRGAQEESPLGINHSHRRPLPVMLHAQGSEQIFLAVLLNVLPRLLLENVSQQFRHAAAVVENLSGLLGHRPVDHVLHPIVGRLHQARIILGIVVRNFFVPV